MSHLTRQDLRAPTGLVLWGALLACAIGLAIVAQVAHPISGPVMHGRRVYEVRAIDFVVLPLMTVVNFPGYSPTREILLGLAVAVLLLRRQWAVAVLVALTSTGDMLAVGAKLFFAEPHADGLARAIVGIYRGGKGSPAGYGFPSGHVVHYVVFFGVLGCLAWRALRSTAPTGRNTRVALAVLLAVCLGLILLVGASRVYPGYHPLNDVLGGYVLGTIWLCALLWLCHPDRLHRSLGMLRSQPASLSAIHASGRISREENVERAREAPNGIAEDTGRAVAEI